MTHESCYFRREVRKIGHQGLLLHNDKALFIFRSDNKNVIHCTSINKS